MGSNESVSVYYYDIFGRKRGVFSKVVLGSGNFRYDSEGLGEMFEGDSADMCAGKFPLMSMGAERRVSCAQTREREPPSALAEI